MRRIHLDICTFFTSAVLMFACADDQIIEENNHNLTPSETIKFDAAVEWPSEDNIGGSRSASASLKRIESPKLRAEESNETLPMGVYVQDGIHPMYTNEPESRGAVITQNNISAFNVWATLNRAENVGGGAIEYFSNVEFAKGDDNVFSSSGKVYYWPGEGPTIDFVAVGNAPESGFTANMTNNEATSFTYTVDQDATKQNDIVLATAPNIAGDNDQSVPLDFKHILSAVNVKVGSQMTAGTINSITFKNIYSKGTYNVASNAWGSVGEPKDYTITFANGSSNYTTEGKAEGTLINGDNATLMMIPQTLANISDTEKVEIIVNFSYAASGQTKDLIASLDGQAWAMGKTTNYYINVSPDFTLSIEEESVPIADCHYDTRIITIKNEHSDVEWTLSSDVDWVKFRIMPDDYETNAYKDFWIENHTIITTNIYIEDNKEPVVSSPVSNNYPITQSISGKGNAKVIVYFYENTGTDTKNENLRESNITLTDGRGNVKDELKLKQYFALWNNNIAYERIEENKSIYPWGFASSRTVTYSYPTITYWMDGGSWWWLRGILQILGWYNYIKERGISSQKAARGETYQSFYNNYYLHAPSGFITISPTGGDGSIEWGTNNDWKATLNYNALNTIQANSDKGITNTSTIYYYTGNNTTGSDAETWLTQYNMVKGNESNQTDATTIPQTATYQAVKKNKWTLTTNITNTRTVITQGDGADNTETRTTNDINLSDGIKWFLPSAAEIATLKPTACDDDATNNDEALTGTYWTSTSGTGTNAFYYNAADETATEISRAATNKHKIRAARMKP